MKKRSLMPSSSGADGVAKLTKLPHTLPEEHEGMYYFSDRLGKPELPKVIGFRESITLYLMPRQFSEFRQWLEDQPFKLDTDEMHWIDQDRKLVKLVLSGDRRPLLLTKLTWGGR
jgi:hypothetical protein